MIESIWLNFDLLSRFNDDLQTDFFSDYLPKVYSIAPNEFTVFPDLDFVIYEAAVWYSNESIQSVKCWEFIRSILQNVDSPIVLNALLFVAYFRPTFTSIWAISIIKTSNCLSLFLNDSTRCYALIKMIAIPTLQSELILILKPFMTESICYEAALSFTSDSVSTLIKLLDQEIRSIPAYLPLYAVCISQ
jgi:hypothetical protein